MNENELCSQAKIREIYLLHSFDTKDQMAADSLLVLIFAVFCVKENTYIY